MLQGGIGENRIGAGVGLRTIICILCLAYFQQIGEPGAGHKKCSPFTNSVTASSSSAWDQANKASYSNTASKGLARSYSSSCFAKDYSQAMSINDLAREAADDLKIGSKKEN